MLRKLNCLVILLSEKRSFILLDVCMCNLFSIDAIFMLVVISHFLECVTLFHHRLMRMFIPGEWGIFPLTVYLKENDCENEN